MDQNQYDALMKKIEAVRESGTVDLSMEEDLSIAVMNLVSLEEHFFFTGIKTDKPEYFDLLLEVRKMRGDLLRKLIDVHEGETWCACKHLLGATMRLIEVGVKLQADKKTEEAREMFSHAKKTYALFLALRLKLIDIGQFKKVAAEEKPWTLDDIVKKLADCCDES